jgi:hypothetical protein
VAENFESLCRAEAFYLISKLFCKPEAQGHRELAMFGELHLAKSQLPLNEKNLVLFFISIPA